MSKYTDRAMELRSHFNSEGRPVCNCAQTVISVFADDVGLDEETCRRMATFFRGGMQMGSVCGAVTGGLMVLGLMGLNDAGTANAFLGKVRQAHGGMLDCRDLLRVNAEQGRAKLPHCNEMICECIGYVEEALNDRR